MKREVILTEYGSADIELSPADYEALSRSPELVRLAGGPRYGVFRLEASSWVGQILLPSLNVFVEPKIGTIDVLRMFLEGDGEATPMTTDALSSRNSGNGVWEVVGSMLSNEALKLAELGLRREYREATDLLVAPKGQILVYQDVLASVPVRKGYACLYDEFSEDTALNQSVRWGLEVLEALVSPTTSIQLRGALSLFEQVTSCDLPLLPSLPPSNDPYYKAIWLVHLIQRSLTRSYSQTGIRCLGLGFDMNKVFEGFVRNRLRQAGKSRGLQISDKRGASTRLNQEVRLEPDFLVSRKGHPFAVADCKYKVDWNQVNADIFQMLAYLEGRPTLGHALILYPSTSGTVKRQISLTRGRYLTTIGLSIDDLFTPEAWDELIFWLLQLTD